MTYAKHSDASRISCTQLTTHTPSATHTHRHTHTHTHPLCRPLCQRLIVLVRIPIHPYQWLSKESIDNIQQLCQYQCQCTNPCCHYVILMKNKSIWISIFDIWILFFSKRFPTPHMIMYSIEYTNRIFTYPHWSSGTMYLWCFVSIGFSKRRINYRQTSNICSTLVGYELVDH